MDGEEWMMLMVKSRLWERIRQPSPVREVPQNFAPLLVARRAIAVAGVSEDGNVRDKIKDWMGRIYKGELRGLTSPLVDSNRIASSFFNSVPHGFDPADYYSTHAPDPEQTGHMCIESSAWNEALRVARKASKVLRESHSWQSYADETYRGRNRISAKPTHSTLGSPALAPDGILESVPPNSGLKFRWGTHNCWISGATSNIASAFLVRSIYHEQLRLLIQNLPHTPLILQNEQLRSQPSQTLHTIHQFLGIKPFADDIAIIAADTEKLDAIAKEKYPLIVQSGWTASGNATTQQLPPDLEQDLRTFLIPFQQATQSLLQQIN